MNPQESIPYLIPEVILTGSMVLILIISLWEKVKKNRLILTLVSVSGLLLSALFIFTQKNDSFLIFQDMLAHDPFAGFFKIIILISAIFTLLSAYHSNEIKTYLFSEFSFILIALSLALCFFVSSTNFLMLYLSLEFVSITSYVLTGFKKENKRANEAALK